MKNELLYILIGILTLSNFLSIYMFWQAVKENNKLEKLNELIRKENIRLNKLNKN